MFVQVGHCNPFPCFSLWGYQRRLTVVSAWSRTPGLSAHCDRKVLPQTELIFLAFLPPRLFSSLTPSFDKSAFTPLMPLTYTLCRTVHCFVSHVNYNKCLMFILRTTSFLTWHRTRLWQPSVSVVSNWSSKGPLWLHVFNPTKQEHTWLNLINQLSCLYTVDLLDQVCSCSHTAALYWISLRPLHHKHNTYPHWNETTC